MATETSNSFGDVGALRFVSVKGWISGIYFLLYRKPLNQNKMTAVEWLIDRLEVNKIIPNPYPGEYWNILKRGAKEMEKEQKKFMFECGRNFQLTGEGTFQEVYNETFKTE